MRRVADCVAFFYVGRLIEFGTVDAIFMNPAEEQTQQYVQGRFG